MSFWIRHAVLVLCSVLVPFSIALYVDTTATIDRARETSRRALQLAVPGLQLILQNEAYRSVSSAVSTARRMLNDTQYADLRRGGSRARTAAQDVLQLLNEATPPGGFAWLINDDGRVVLASGQEAIDESPRSIRGHPLFVETQLGYALDGVWSSHQSLVQVAGAPLVESGVIKGAILIGRPIDKELVGEWAETLRGHITLTNGQEVVVSSAPNELAKPVVAAAYDAVSPVYAGESERSLSDSSLPFLPLLMDHRARGEAFVSFGTPVLGAPSRFQWVISIDATAGLEEVSRRQSSILGVMAVAFLVAMLVGILNYRSYVLPHDLLAEHLAEINQGKADLQMAENAVSLPFRRIVRLLNMIMAKNPARALGVQADLSGLTSGLSRPPDSRGDLVVQSSSTGNIATGAAPIAAGLGPLAAAPQPIDALESVESVSLDSVVASVALPSEPPAPQMASYEPALANGGASFETSEETEASMLPPPLGFEPKAIDMQELGVPEGAEAAIADAIAQLEGAAADYESGASSRKSAADIRGRPMGVAAAPPSRDSGPFEEINMQTSPPRGIRGGGSLDLGQAAGLAEDDAAERAKFGPEETVVAPVATELLAKSAREDLTGRHALSPDDKPDATVVANVPADLLAQSAGASEAPSRTSSLPSPAGLEPEDRAHFKEVYERFIDLRRRCGEPTSDLAFDRFLQKLSRNRQNLVKKYNCRTVRFQVYKKDGKAALKATPVGARA